MNIQLKAEKFTLDEEQKVFLDKKLERIKFAEDLITDVLFNIKFEKKFLFDVTINFRWGGNAHVSSEDFDFSTGANKLIDVLDQKIKKEKEKIQQKQ